MPENLEHAPFEQSWINKIKIRVISFLKNIHQRLQHFIAWIQGKTPTSAQVEIPSSSFTQDEPIPPIMQLPKPKSEPQKLPEEAQKDEPIPQGVQPSKPKADPPKFPQSWEDLKPLAMDFVNQADQKLRSYSDFKRMIASGTNESDIAKLSNSINILREICLKESPTPWQKQDAPLLISYINEIFSNIEKTRYETQTKTQQAQKRFDASLEAAKKNVTTAFEENLKKSDKQFGV